MNKLITFLLTICLLFHGNIQPLKSQTIKPKIISFNSKEHQKLLSLIRNLYKWKNTTDEKNYEFYPIRSENSKDSLIHGLDMKWTQKRIKDFHKTNFFAKGFIDNYNRIALTIDKNLKSKTIEWQVGDMSPFGGDSNLWCDCQDYPDNFWETMTIENVKINKNIATFVWTWGGKTDMDWGKHSYTVKAIKENDIWKILYLKRFDFQELTKVY